MREDEHRSDQPESQHGDENDTEWKSWLGIAAFLAITTVATILHIEKWRFQSAECKECGMVFLSKGYLYRHERSHNKY